MIEVLQLLHNLSDANTRHSYSYYVRHLTNDESIPQFGHGIPNTPLAQREWIWIAFSEFDNQPLALLAASPMHGVAMLVRVYATNLAPKSVFVGLLRKSLADIYSRGYTTYATLLDLERPEEAKLAKIILKAGGSLHHKGLTCYHGPTDIKGI